MDETQSQPQQREPQQAQQQAQQQPQQRTINSRTANLRQRTQDRMVEAEHIDGWGRKFRVMVKEGGDPAQGMILGPAPLDDLGLKRADMVELHNQLYDRGLVTMDDVRRRPMDVLAAINTVQKVNVQRIQNVYAGVAQQSEPTPPEPEATTPQASATMQARQAQAQPDVKKEDSGNAPTRS